ncbi:MAG: Holliday junction branch migration protein RuvA [bacterium]|nr:Holliday junction branch migration protein RuvA [bacterium]
MLAFIRGTVQLKDEHSLIIISHDIGYRVFVSGNILHTVSIGEMKELFLHHHIREDCSDLYGFQSPRELVFYEQLLSISGIGPKTALGIISAAPIEKLASAISRGDAALLKGISGIGAKTADRIVIELRGKVVSLSQEEKTPNGYDTLDQEIVDALVELGYQRGIAGNIVSTIPASISTPEDRLKAALKMLASTKK